MGSNAKLISCPALTPRGDVFPKMIEASDPGRGAKLTTQGLVSSSLPLERQRDRYVLGKEYGNNNNHP